MTTTNDHPKPPPPKPKPGHARVSLTLEFQPQDDDRDGIRRLRWAVKWLGRIFNFRCVDLRPGDMRREGHG